MRFVKTSHISQNLEKLIHQAEKEFARRIGNIFIKEDYPHIVERYRKLIEQEPNYRILEATKYGHTIGAIGYLPSKRRIDWMFLLKDYYYHPFQTELIETAIKDMLSYNNDEADDDEIKASLWCPKLLKRSLIAPAMRKYNLSFANRYLMACRLDKFDDHTHPLTLPPEYEMEEWDGKDSKEQDEVAKVVSSAYATSVPLNLQPIWKNVTVEGARAQIEGLFAGKYGEVKPKYLSLIRHQSRICAVNISTIATPYSGYIVNLAVSPEHQHKGLGTVMLLHSMKLFKSDGYKWACLSVREGNPVIHLYRRKGFRSRAYVLSIASQQRAEGGGWNKD